MKKLLVLFLLLGARGIGAQVDDPTEYPVFEDPAPDAPRARLRLVLDPVSGATEAALAPGATVDVHVVAHDVQIAVRAWEARLVVDPRLVLIERDVPAAVDLGQNLEVRAAFKPRDCRAGSPIVLGRFRFLLPPPGGADLVIGLAAADKPSAPADTTGVRGPVPVYLTCRPGADLRPFDACTECVVLNPVERRAERDATDSQLERLLEPVRGRQR